MFDSAQLKSKKHKDMVKLPVPVTLQCVRRARAFSRKGVHRNLDAHCVHTFAVGDTVELQYLHVDEQQFLWFRTTRSGRSVAGTFSFLGPFVCLCLLYLQYTNKMTQTNRESITLQGNCDQRHRLGTVRQPGNQSRHGTTAPVGGAVLVQ